jgi:hypothetical protein
MKKGGFRTLSRFIQLKETRLSNSLNIHLESEKCELAYPDRTPPNRIVLVTVDCN